MRQNNLFCSRTKVLFILLTISLYTFSNITKNPYEDSIRYVINTTKFDTVKIENYIIIGFQLKPTLDSSIFYLSKGVELSAKIKNHFREGVCLNLIGIKYFENGLLDSALSSFNRLLKLSLKYNHIEAISNAYLNIGGVYKEKKYYSNAIDYFHSSLKYMENPNVYSNIGEVYYLLKQSDKALKYIDKGLKIATKNIDNSDEYSKMGAYYALLNLLSAKSKVFLFQKKYKETIPILEQMLKTSEYIHNDYTLCTSYADLASTYNQLNDKVNSEKNYTKAFDLSKNLNNELLTNSLKSNYVEFLLQNKRYAEAENILKELIIYFNGKQDALEYLVQCYNSYGALYAKTNQADKAIASFEKSAEITDSITMMNNTAVIAEMEAKYQSEKKEKENLVLKQQNLEKETQAFQQKMIIIILVSLIIISIVFVILYLNHKKTIRAKEKAELERQLIDLENKALRLQMNPHFIFNALNSIQGFITENNPVAAKKYLAKFARLMRLILENSMDSTISLQNEIEVLNNYLELTALRFSNKFNFVINVDQLINTSDIEIPPMLLQPFVENAILHGLEGKEDSGTIHIDFKRNTNSIECTIEDDGVGRQKAMEQKPSSHKSTGMMVTEERLKIFSEKNNTKAKLNVIDLMDKLGNACGTKVVIDIPIQQPSWT